MIQVWSRRYEKGLITQISPRLLASVDISSTEIGEVNHSMR
jgi:hypothetical protein